MKPRRNVKSQLTKLYEKFVMLLRNPESLSLMVAEGQDGGHAIVVGLVPEPGAFIPLARLLTQNELDALEPDMDMSKRFMTDVIQRLRQDVRRSVSDFNQSDPDIFPDGLLPYFENGV